MALNEHEIMIKELENAIDRLNALYNQYFMGIEKLEPTIPFKDVERKIQALRKIKFNNTAFRFRFQAQVQKFNTQRSYWQRICRQIEEGTYERDIKRAKKRIKAIDEVGIAQNALNALGEDATNDNISTSIDFDGMLGELDDAFSEGFSIEDQIKSLEKEAVASVGKIHSEVNRQLNKDSVHPVGSETLQSSDRSNSGVKIPQSSIRVSLKNDSIGGKTDTQNQSAPSAVSQQNDLGNFFNRPPMPPPPPPRPPAGGTGHRPPPPPPPRTSSSATAEGRQVSPPASPNRIPSTSQTGTGINDDKIKSVYRAYVSARKQTNEGTDNVNFDKIASLLRKTEKAKGGVTDFKVVIKNGKAVIKTVK
ncbi:MAG: hypothetical protein JXR91_01770 [Deltaproteobacteria bacterium]|nr:hypothetical protein [Deltaproteobacteria bacterium]